MKNKAILFSWTKAWLIGIKSINIQIGMLSPSPSLLDVGFSFVWLSTSMPEDSVSINADIVLGIFFGWCGSMIRRHKTCSLILNLHHPLAETNHLPKSALKATDIHVYLSTSRNVEPVYLHLIAEELIKHPMFQGILNWRRRKLCWKKKQFWQASLFPSPTIFRPFNTLPQNPDF